MRQHDRAVVASIVALLTVLWLGFFVHRSADFAGSGWGGVFAVSGTLLMLVPLVYSIVKRISPLRRAVGPGMRTFLIWHIYSGLAGTALVLIHSGHKFQSPLGVALTAMTLLVVLSGFVGRYLLGFIAEDVRTKQAHLGALRNTFVQLSGLVAKANGDGPTVKPSLAVVESMADLEYGIRTEERIRAFFSQWLKFHLMISAILYGLLGLHVWAALEFGLRWFPSATP
ncbi:hypothetical protein [Tahibacter amnicola]|uniref:Ferric reductase like protein n=1 Tax=Tahibacter amnicola TaxID=2976241 RepID=A0ABY6BBQ8_9GAMM|nr:hypothetical protein [Tahibacter amnicola]UXI66071.1 hypothetical protein N4264_15060 [Tahibacter amnicola]